MRSVLLLAPHLDPILQPMQPFRYLFVQSAAASQTLELILEALGVVVGQNNREHCEFEGLKY